MGEINGELFVERSREKEFKIMQSMIKVDNVTKKFGSDTVLCNVSLEFEKGKIYGIVGGNGSGKTVLFKIIIGFLKPTSGRVIVDGKKSVRTLILQRI